MKKELHVVYQYRIGLTTMALLSHRHPQYQTQIKDMEGDFMTDDTAREILHRGCLDDSCTYDGRRIATIHFTNYIQKTPILIDQAEGIIAIPTHSPDQETCCWLFLHHLSHVESVSSTRCIVVFNNHDRLALNVSAITIYEQVKKAAVVLTRFCSNKQFNFSLNPKVKRSRNDNKRKKD
ncbi:competence protein ComK [Bacillus sp. LL01]|uniref:competence protein ComK n=1 Tax=Bacillus sp. LL01 TaxID=1665556 RepID=UPI00069F3C04|nr:competence protein ComK [Bacillus sp. LL01]